ncbi:MAG: DUF4153 domain-containing protein [Pseudorhodoplanes sp.]
MTADTMPLEKPQRIFLARLVIGLAQGVALYLLYKAAQQKTWPATNGLVFAPLSILVVFVPLVAATSLGNFRRRTFAIWIVVASMLCAGLAFYDIHRDPLTVYQGAAAAPRVLGSWLLVLSLAILIFIAHCLIEAGDADRRFIARYPQYHDVSWKLGVQHVLGLLFVGVFWALLWLGAALFSAINIRTFQHWLLQPWFYIPATTLAWSAAIHLTDVRTGIVRGTRTLALSLLSWLLPVTVAITAAFLLTLPFTGLEPLWHTRRAATLLLTAAGALIVLLNCAYPEDPANNRPAAIILYARALAVPLIAAITALAAYGLYLRVAQYGWTTQRAIALACIAVAASYALGYLFALIRDGLALRRLETTNVVTALLICAIIIALRTPLADPARIAVASQVARLEAGTTPVDKFDFAYLRFRSGIYGEQALERLKRKEDGPDAARIAFKANEALDWRSPSQSVNAASKPREADATTRKANIVLKGADGQSLPDSFFQFNWNAVQPAFRLPPCLVRVDAKCNALLIDVDEDGEPEIILINGTGFGGGAFKDGKDGVWKFLGTLSGLNCKGVREALETRQFEIRRAPADIEAAGQRVHIVPDSNCATR